MTEIRGLGYVRVQATDTARWRELGFDVLGFAPGSGPEVNALHFRMDERRARITVEHGDADRVTAVGWEVRDEAALRRLAHRLDENGCEYAAMPVEICEHRSVEGGLVMKDPPGGTPLEFFFGPALDHSPVITRYGQKFVTGAQGMGHVVMPTARFDESYRFYTEVLEFLPRGAFRMPTPPGTPPQRIRFLGVNQRHHSLAIMPTLEGGRDPGLIHVMVEVDSLDAVGRALDQVEARNFPVSSTLGRHTNDKMISFYVQVPGGWDIEYGTEARSSTRRTTPRRRSPRTATGATSGCGPDRRRPRAHDRGSEHSGHVRTRLRCGCDRCGHIRALRGVQAPAARNDRAGGLRIRGGSGGGTWFHNRYPGARCDVESIDYSYSFDEELQQEWTWSERFATQEEILSYLEHVADRHDLRPAYEFLTRVTSAVYDEESARWSVTTDTGRTVIARFCIMATGVLSATNRPDIPGRDSFAGESYHTGEWPPHSPVDFTGKRVGVIGTGSSGMQSIPLIAQDAEHVFVYQRSPNYSIPAGNRPLTPEQIAEVKASYPERRRLARLSGGGTPPFTPYPKGAMEVDEAERRRVYDEWWQRGGYLFAKAFPDQTVNLESNDTAREYVESKIREMVNDPPEIADQLIPTDHPIGTKRIVTDSGYFETYNRDNVTLINLRRTPLVEITETGIRTSEEYQELDVLVYATGFDAMTGALSRIDIRGRDGRTLRDEWAAGPRTYLACRPTASPPTCSSWWARAARVCWQTWC